jgi:predicted nucleotidyltransferase
MQCLTQAEIRKGLEMVNAWLAVRGTKGEICIYGGACLCLAFAARSSTKDVDAVFEPASLVRKAAFGVASEMGWSWNWLNDEVKGFLSIHDADGIEFLDSFELSHLKVYVANPEYLLAMKCLAARMGQQEEGEVATDLNDALWLSRHLGFSSREEIARVVLKFFPDRELPERTGFFVEELLEQLRES